MLLEVIATNLTDAKIAEESGADRIELITGILEGGLTPSYGLIEKVVNAVAIPVYVMVRPHSHSFCYSRDDLDTMLADIRTIRKIGADGIVTGALTEARTVDRSILEALLAEAGELDVTFHRAFDEAADQRAALQVLLQYPQITRILTSGGKKSALDAVGEIRELVRLTEHTHLTILAGSGLKIGSLQAFAEQTGVKEVHFGTGVRSNEQALQLLDPEKIEAIKMMFAQ